MPLDVLALPPQVLAYLFYTPLVHTDSEDGSGSLKADLSDSAYLLLKVPASLHPEASDPQSVQLTLTLLYTDAEVFKQFLFRRHLYDFP